MSSKNPQVSIRLTPEEYKYLQGLAERNFVTLPTFVKILVKRTIAEDKEKRDYLAS
jgi:predicted DNA-binding protein